MGAFPDFDGVGGIGDLRAIVAMAADADDDIVNFEVSHFDDNIITGIYLEVVWPR